MDLPLQYYRMPDCHPVILSWVGTKNRESYAEELQGVFENLKKLKEEGINVDGTMRPVRIAMTVDLQSLLYLKGK